jgi:hypothetical protein
VRDLASRRALMTLPDGWRALHDVRSTRRHLTAIDHIVVGPAGVFLVSGDSLDVSVAKVADAAIALAELIPMDPRHVVPVVCANGGAVPAWAHDVLVCPAEQLVETITQRPPVLDPHLAELVFARLKEALPAASSSGSGRTAKPVRRPPGERRAPTPKPLPWTPGQEVSPAVKSALIAIAICLVLCPILAVTVWPVVHWFIAMVTSL